MEREPKTLQEAIVYFSKPENCIDYLAVRRWPNGVACPGCGSTKVSFNANRRTWKCGSHHAKREFSVKVGTIFEESPISLDKWLTAVWMLTNCKNGVSSYEIARDIKVTQKTAWFMLHRIRLAMQDDEFGGKLGGGEKEIEVDETFIGAKARNVHKHKRADKLGMANKAMVVGVLERGGKIRAHVAQDRKAPAVCSLVRQHVIAESAVFTDKLLSYKELDDEYAHEVVDHAERYVDGRVHTNGLENFWSLLKRGLHGTYVSVEPFHLFRYLDEQMFRYNNRRDEEKNPIPDYVRFDRVISQIVGKRITFAQLTAKPN